MNVKKHGIVLCGAGRIGIVHHQNILNNRRFELFYVVDVILAKAQELAEQAGPQCKALATVDEALKDDRVTTVLIATPTAFHHATILAAARAKKHIMCEKPISLEVHEIDECYAEAQKQNVQLLCGYQRRHDASFAKLQQAVRDGAIGIPEIIKTTSRDHPPPTMEYLKISGGIMHDCASHDVDVLRWVSGEDPISVFAQGSCFSKEIEGLGIGDWDNITISMKFPSGCLGLIDVSRHATYGYDQRIEVLGTKGMLQAENKRKTTVVFSNEAGSLIDPTRHSFPQRSNDLCY